MKHTSVLLIGLLVFVARASSSDSDDWNAYKVSIIFAVIIFLFQSILQTVQSNQFCSFIKICLQIKYSKKYRSEAEDKSRMEIFLKNKEKISEHNELYEKRLSSYKMGLNDFSDLTDDEFNSRMNLQRLFLPNSLLSHSIFGHFRWI